MTLSTIVEDTLSLKSLKEKQQKFRRHGLQGKILKIFFHLQERKQGLRQGDYHQYVKQLYKNDDGSFFCTCRRDKGKRNQFRLGEKKTKQETHSDNKGVRHWKKLLEDSVEFEAVDICRKAYDRNC